jgi:hypothetical protein
MDLLALENTDDLGWWIDPKDADPRPEEKRQLAFLRLAKLLCPGVDIFAVPNGAKRSQWEAAKATREGVKAGALDLVATWENGGVAFLEFKSGRTMPDDNQRDRLNRLTRQSHLCGVFRQEVSAIEFLRRNGAPFIGRLS